MDLIKAGKDIDHCLNTLNIMGDARGVFYPEIGRTKIDSILNYKSGSIYYEINIAFV